MCMNGEVGAVIGLVETGSFGTITGGRIKADESVRQCAFQETKLFCILGECKQEKKQYGRLFSQQQVVGFEWRTAESGVLSRFRCIWLHRPSSI